MAEAIPLKVVDGADPGEKKLAELGAGDTIPEAHLPNSVALDSELAAHTGNTNNPHQVTLVQLGGITQALLDTHANNADLHRQIDDAAETAINLWSALKIKAAIQAKIDELVGSAPGALDTINELATALGNDPNAIATLTSELALKIPLTDRGAADGVCELINGLVPETRLIFGTWFQPAHDLGVSRTTSTSWRTKLTLTTPANLPLGEYRLAAGYGWNHNNSSSDFNGRVVHDSTLLRQEHFQEPQDTSGNWMNTGTNQRHYLYRIYYLEDLQGVNTFTLQYRTSKSGEESSIWDASMEFWRVA